MVSNNRGVCPIRVRSRLHGFSGVGSITIVNLPSDELNRVITTVVRVGRNTAYSRSRVGRFYGRLPHCEEPGGVVFSGIPHGPANGVRGPMLHRGCYRNDLIRTRVG